MLSPQSFQVRILHPFQSHITTYTCSSLWRSKIVTMLYEGAHLALWTSTITGSADAMWLYRGPKVGLAGNEMLVFPTFVRRWLGSVSTGHHDGGESAPRQPCGETTRGTASFWTASGLRTAEELNSYFLFVLLDFIKVLLAIVLIAYNRFTKGVKVSRNDLTISQALFSMSFPDAILVPKKF